MNFESLPPTIIEHVSELSVSDLAQLIIELVPDIKRSEAYNIASRLKKKFNQSQSNN